MRALTITVECVEVDENTTGVKFEFELDKDQRIPTQETIQEDMLIKSIQTYAKFFPMLYGGQVEAKDS